MALRRRLPANDEAPAQPLSDDELAATLNDPDFRRGLESVIEGLIELLDEADGDADRESDGDDRDDEALI